MSKFNRPCKIGSIKMLAAKERFILGHPRASETAHGVVIRDKRNIK